MSQPVLHVQMLGGFSLHLGSEPVPPMPSRPSASLLAYLILNRDRAQTRDLLAGRFWSDLAEDKARRRLSNALWQIGDAIKEGPAAGLELLSRTTNSLQFNGSIDVTVDAEIFQRRLDEFERRSRTDRRAVHQSDLTAIVDSYRGDLLAGYYDEWIGAERDRLSSRYATALSQLVQLNSAQADYETALRYGRMLVNVEPLSEEWQRELMRLYFLNGQPSVAERQYEAFGRALEAELGVEPDPKTTDLIEQIRRDAASPPLAFSSSDDAPVAFVGRANERAALLGRVIEVVNGKGGLVLIEGDPGVGKSRLAEEVAKGAEWRGAQVLVGSHTMSSPMTPYEGLKEALEPVTVGLKGERLAESIAPLWLVQASSVLEGLVGVVGPGGHQALRPQDEPWRTTEALARIILAQGTPKPTVLILEDIHWCDEDTLAVLVQLGERLIDSQILICVTYQLHEAQRSPASWKAISELEAKPGSSRHVVPPLEESEIKELVLSELGPGRMSETAMDQLVGTTGGNPYLVLELLRSPIDLFDEELFDVADRLDEHLLPRLADILIRRIDSTSEHVRAVLEAVAALGGPASPSMVGVAVGLDRPTVVSALAEAVELGFLVESERGCDFAQDQSRRAVYDAIAIERLSGLHGRIVDALVGENVGVSQLARHAWLAGQWHRAYQYHSLAAEGAFRVNAFQTSAEHFAKADHAAQSAGLSDRDRIDDLFEYEQVLGVLGRRQEQQALLERMLGLDDLESGTALNVRQRHAWLLANTDRAAEAARLATAAVGPARAAGHNVGELLTIVGCARAWSGDFGGAIGPLREAIDALGDEGFPATAAHLMLGRTYSDLQQFDGAHRHLEEAYNEAKEANDARSQVEALGHLATMWHSQGNEVQAEAAFLEALELAREIGYRHGEGLNQLNLASFYVRQGRGGKAVELFRAADEVFASLGNGRGQAFGRTNASELAHRILGDDAAALDQAEAAAVYFREVGDRRREAACLNTLASVERRQGKRRLAKRRLMNLVTKAVSSDDPATASLTQFNLGLVEFDLEHHHEALEHVEQALSICREHGVDSLMPALLATKARILVQLDQLDEALALVSRVISSNRRGVDLAHLAAWWSAEILATAEKPGPASEQVALAHQLLSQNLEDLPHHVVQTAWSNVPEHRAIAEAREMYFVDQVEWRIPRSDAPVGRPLEADDFLDVTLTKSHPDDWEISSASARRRHRVMRLTAQAAEQGGAARVSDLAEVLEWSDRTIKRDLAQLRAEGQNPPTRGGFEENL